jgi:HlyD family secretion protein
VSTRKKSLLAVVVVAALAVAAAALSLRARASEPKAPGSASTTFTVVRKDFVRNIRLNGTVEAIESTSIPAPRLAGQNSNSLVIMRLVPNGTTVKKGDVLVEFDRQEQIRNALDRKADLTDLEQQISKAQAEEIAAKASDESAIKQAQDAQAKAKLELIKNDMLPKIEAEKNTLTYEQAQATLKQLQDSYGLKRAAATANIKVLEIRRDRSEQTMKQAESNADKMLIVSPLPGVAVIRTTWKNGGNSPVEFTEGDEVRPGQPVVEVVNPASMRVRARVNQTDVNELQIGQPVKIGLDAYPDLSFQGTIVQISPVGQQSTLSPKVRTFVVLVVVQGAHPNLMPDLTASLDVQLELKPGLLVVPRDAVVSEGEQSYVMVRRGGTFERRDVAIGDMGATDAVVTSGLQEGVTVARNAASLTDKTRRPR